MLDALRYLGECRTLRELQSLPQKASPPRSLVRPNLISFVHTDTKLEC